MINPLRAVLEFPEIETKIQEGELSISAVSQVQSFCNAQEKENAVIVTQEQKKELFAAVEGKTRKESEQALASLFPQNPLSKKDKEKPLNQAETQITFVAGVDLMAELSLKRLDPVKRSNSVAGTGNAPQAPFEPPKVAPKTPEKPLETPHSRYIPAKVRRDAWILSGGQCSFVSKITGKRCTERNNLEFDHKQPFAAGGDNSISNIETKCRAHNIYVAVEKFGPIMDSYLRAP